MLSPYTASPILAAAASEVLLARPRGFCAGVVRAIEIVERALEAHGAPVYVFHEIVHNRQRTFAADGADHIQRHDVAGALPDRAQVRVAHQPRSAWSFNVEIRPFGETW